MVRMLRRAARLLLAGALGVALPPAAHLIAQDVPYSPGPVQVTPSQMRLEAMKVEMALLADYATYDLPLSVRVEQDCLSLHGQVNDEHTRLHALRIARQACYTPVKDALHGPKPPAPIQSVHLDAMRRTVRDVLERTLGDHVNELSVRINAEGQVTLTGMVATVEDKVTASRSLRGLPGCNSVVNCLEVMTHRQAGHTLTLVTRDGQHAVHGVVATAEPAPRGQPIARVDDQDPPSEARPTRQASVPQPPPASTESVPGLPPARDVYVRLRSATQVAPTTYVAPTSSYLPATQPAPQSAATVPTPARTVGPVSNAAPARTAAPTPAPTQQTPVQAYVIVPYAAQGAMGAVQLATAPPARPPVTMFGRMRSVFVGEHTTAPAAPVVAGQTGSLVMLPMPAPADAVNYYTRGATAQTNRVTQTAAPPVQAPTPAPAQAVQAPTQEPAAAEQAPKQPPAFASAPGETKWPPPYNTGEAHEKKRPRPVLTNSPAVRLAARPELASQIVPVADKQPAPKSEAKAATKAEEAPKAEAAPKPESILPPPASEPKPAKTPTRLPSLIQSLTRVVSPVKATPVETTVVTMAEPPVSPAPAGPRLEKAEVVQTSGTATMESPAHAYKVVKEVLGKLAKSVDVETTPDGKPVVHVHASGSAEKEIISRVLSNAEIAASDLRLQIHLDD